MTTERVDGRAMAARLTVLRRAYPLLKQASELLELEAIEPQATTAKKLRQDVGAMLAELGHVMSTDEVAAHVDEPGYRTIDDRDGGRLDR